ncbi:hypothetical protein COHA_003959 [Chlorella ohadii]|uniref:Uncharacterized protein n=1 Tax=Chlorella ohadii TaxID=2649997 RepID=A0AAD5DTW2_9CHLO|nr:hypothetical protein COHA_003959 [Chlorella ohadii]
MEMREAVAPDENKWNSESTQMHHFSEKARFDKGRYTNAQKATGAAATPGDTSSYETLTPASSQTAPGQTHGVLHQSPETLKQARPRGPGEFDDNRDVGLAEEIESKPAEEAAADGQRTLPGSQGGAAPGQEQQGQEGGTEMGVEPSIRYTPSEAPGQEAGELDSQTSRRPDPPDERAPEIHEEPGGEPSAQGAPSPTAAQFQGGSVGNAEVGRSSYHTWARRLPLPGVGSSRRGLRTQVVARAAGGPQGDPTSERSSSTGGADMTSHAARPPPCVQPPAAPADQASRMPPNVGAESRPSERSAEEPESGGTSSSSSAGAAEPSESDVEGPGADAVMERRVDDPSVGGIAS